MATDSVSGDADSLPALLSRAGQRLLYARTSAQVLEAKKIAELALHYAKVTNAANETHADCLRIITRAEMRMADEVDALDKNKGGRLKSTPRFGEVSAPTIKELGVDDRRLSEWRQMRDAGPEQVEEVIRGALADGRAPTKADIHRSLRATHWTGNNEWNTPPEYVELAREVLGTIDIDPATNALAQQTGVLRPSTPRKPMG